MITKVLVVGGTGMLGRPVTLSLHERGYQVRVLSRNPDQVKDSFPQGIEVTRGVVESPEDLERAMEGVQGVHLNLNGGPRPEDYERIQHQGAVNALRAAGNQGVKRISMISGLNADPQSKVPSIRAKGLAEEALKASSIPYTIFKPTWFFESLPLFVRGKSAAILGKQPFPLSWVSAKDYGGLVAKSFSLKEAENQTFPVLGPDKLTMNQALEVYLNAKHPGMKISTIPIPMGKLMGILSFSWELKDLVQLFEFFEKNPEPQGDDLTKGILGTCSTTLNQWLVN